MEGEVGLPPVALVNHIEHLGLTVILMQPQKTQSLAHILKSQEAMFPQRVPLVDLSRIQVASGMIRLPHQVDLKEGLIMQIQEATHPQEVP